MLHAFKKLLVDRSLHLRHDGVVVAHGFFSHLRLEVFANLAPLGEAGHLAELLLRHAALERRVEGVVARRLRVRHRLLARLLLPQLGRQHPPLLQVQLRRLSLALLLLHVQQRLALREVALDDALVHPLFEGPRLGLSVARLQLGLLRALELVQHGGARAVPLVQRLNGQLLVHTVLLHLFDPHRLHVVQRGAVGRLELGVAFLLRCALGLLQLLHSPVLLLQHLVRLRLLLFLSGQRLALPHLFVLNLRRALLVEPLPHRLLPLHLFLLLRVPGLKRLLLLARVRHVAHLLRLLLVLHLPHLGVQLVSKLGLDVLLQLLAAELLYHRLLLLKLGQLGPLVVHLLHHHRLLTRLRPHRRRSPGQPQPNPVLQEPDILRPHTGVGLHERDHLGTDDVLRFHVLGFVRKSRSHLIDQCLSQSSACVCSRCCAAPTPRTCRSGSSL
mmetsp:Transcript_1577/g.2923  ORF Transcript_1577/g.2923 Transcript_1577/m.2923 type:complete len:443 (-) Transcript_1577:235-1563(-)